MTIKGREGHEDRGGEERAPAWAASLLPLETDSESREQDRRDQTDHPADDGREFVVDPRHGQHRDHAGKDRKVNEAEVAANDAPIDHQSQGNHGDDHRRDALQDRGLHADVDQLTLRQFEKLEAKPHRCADCAEGGGSRIENEAEQRHAQRRKPKRDQHRSCQRGGSSEAASPLDEEDECPSHHHELCHGVARDLPKPRLQYVQGPRLLERHKKENCAEDDGNRREGVEQPAHDGGVGQARTRPEKPNANTVGNQRREGERNG